jgi:hypothetical protein
MQELQEKWEFSGGGLADIRDQNTITTIMKARAHRHFLESCRSDDDSHNAALGFQSIPTLYMDSRICSESSPGDDHLSQCPMTVLELMCPLDCRTTLSSLACQMPSEPPFPCTVPTRLPWL